MLFLPFKGDVGWRFRDWPRWRAWNEVCSFFLCDDIDGSLLDFHVDFRDIESDDAEEQALDGGEEGDADDDGRVALDRFVEEERLDDRLESHDDCDEE